jgi:hypothetical protein
MDGKGSQNFYNNNNVNFGLAKYISCGVFKGDIVILFGFSISLIYWRMKFIVSWGDLG